MIYFAFAEEKGISWAATGKYSGSLLEDIAVACNFESGPDAAAGVKVCLHETPPPLHIATKVIWSKYFADKFHVAVSDDYCRYDFYLNLLRMNKQQLLFFRRIVSCLPLIGSILNGDGILLHGALADFRRRGILFCGESGAGKSTAMRSLPDSWKKYCDDAVWIVRKKDGYYAHPLPTWSCDFYDVEPLPCNTMKSIKVDLICHLLHGDTDRLTLLSKPQSRIGTTMAATTLLYILRAGLSTAASKAVMSKSFEFACEMSESLNGYRLDVKLGGNFWGEIEKLTIQSLHESKLI